MNIVKIAVLAVGVVVFVVGMIQSGLSVGNELAAAGLWLFSVGAAPYFAVLPVSKDENRGWRFNTDFVYLSVYMVVFVFCSWWLWRIAL